MSARIGSLFSGYGGLDCAVKSVIPSRVSWFCEYEKAPSKVLAHHWPGVPNLNDITQVDWSTVEPVDIITGGSPCQDLSHAGRRAGMTEGTRSNLWVQMREAIAALKPSIVVWENVRGAYSAEADSDVEPCPGCVGDGSGVHLRALGRVLGDLADLGYDAQWRGLRAADVGAPHGRFRVFVVAHARGEVGDLGAGLRASGPRGVGRGRSGDRDGTTPADAASDGRHQGRTEPTGEFGGPDASERSATPTNPGGIHGERRRGHGNLAGTPGAGEADREQRQRHGDATDDRGATATDATGDGWQWRTEATAGRREDGDRPRGESARRVRWGQYDAAIRRWEHVIGRPAPAPTEPGTRGGQRLSPRFVEWMMGLATGHVTGVPGISRNDQLKMLGNGVVPRQAAAALRMMLPAVLERAA